MTGELEHLCVMCSVKKSMGMVEGRAQHRVCGNGTFVEVKLGGVP